MPVSRLNAAANLLGLLYPASHAAIETCFPCMSASLAKRIRCRRAYEAIVMPYIFWK